MILEGLFGLLSGIINLIPFELPDLPERFYTVLNFIFNSITSSLGIIDMFIDLQFWIQCAVAMVIISNIKLLWNGTIWLLNLIPSVNIPFWK